MPGCIMRPCDLAAALDVYDLSDSDSDSVRYRLRDCFWEVVEGQAALHLTGR